MRRMPAHHRDRRDHRDHVEEQSSVSSAFSVVNTNGASTRPVSGFRLASCTLWDNPSIHKHLFASSVGILLSCLVVRHAQAQSAPTTEMRLSANEIPAA